MCFYRFVNVLQFALGAYAWESISPKNNRYRKKSAALPAAALPFTAADRDWNRTAQNFFEILLAIPHSAVLQKMSIFENTALVRVSAHAYTQVCFANLELNWTRYFSAQFKLGQSGSTALPLPRVPPFFMYIRSFFMYTFLIRNPSRISNGLRMRRAIF